MVRVLEIDTDTGVVPEWNNRRARNRPGPPHHHSTRVLSVISFYYPQAWQVSPIDGQLFCAVFVHLTTKLVRFRHKTYHYFQ